MLDIMLALRANLNNFVSLRACLKSILSLKISWTQIELFENLLSRSKSIFAVDFEAKFLVKILDETKDVRTFTLDTETASLFISNCGETKKGWQIWYRNIIHIIQKFFYLNADILEKIEQSHIAQGWRATLPARYPVPGHQYYFH